jgi:hypothetical protein
VVAVGAPNKTTRSSTAYSGGFAVERPGAMCRPNTAVGTPSIGGSGDGARPGLGGGGCDACRDHGEQRPLQHRQHHRPRPRLGSGRKKWDSSTRSWPLAGGGTSKLHCLADVLGRPVAFHLTVGKAAGCKANGSLIDVPGCAPNALFADKGYDADAIRADLAEQRSRRSFPAGQTVA